ncbi:hypothetical protein D3C81_1005040 [compost metagenome]
MPHADPLEVTLVAQGLRAAQPQRGVARLQLRWRLPQAQYVALIGLCALAHHQQRFDARIQGRRQHRQFIGAGVLVQHQQRFLPAGLRLHLPAARFQLRLQLRQRTGHLHIQRPALVIVEFVAACRQLRPVVLPPGLRVHRQRRRKGRLEAFQLDGDVARCVPHRRHCEDAVEQPRHRLDPERAVEAAAVGDAQHQQPERAEQHAADDVTQPVRAQVQAREADQADHDARYQVRPDAGAAGHFAGDQHREEAEGDGGHGHRHRREAEAAAGIDRAHHIDGGAEQFGQGQAEGQCGQPMGGRHPAPAPDQVAHCRSGCRQQHLPCAQRGQGGHRVVGQRIAQGQHCLVHQQIHRQGLAVGDYHGQQGEPAPAQQQQHQRQHRQRHRFAALRVEHADGVATECRVPVGPVEQAGQPVVHARGRPAIAVQHDGPDKAEDHRQQAGHHDQPAGNRSNGVIGFAEDPARGQEQHGPGNTGDATGLYIAAGRHLHHAGDGGHEWADGTDIAGDQDALERIAAEQVLAPVKQLRVAAERPDATQAVAPAPAYPVADAITGERTQRCGCNRIRPGDLAQADEHADGEQQRQRRHDGAKNDDRIAEGDQKDDRTRQHGMSGNPREGGVDP